MHCSSKHILCSEPLYSQSLISMTIGKFNDMSCLLCIYPYFSRQKYAWQRDTTNQTTSKLFEQKHESYFLYPFGLNEHHHHEAFVLVLRYVVDSVNFRACNELFNAFVFEIVYMLGVLKTTVPRT